MQISQGNPVGEWKAKWIWYPHAQRNVNFFFLARKSVHLKSNPDQAWLQITANSDYILYVNGNYIGRGPNPSEPENQYFDIHDLKGILQEGENIIAIQVHNFGVGMHWQRMGPGGLLFQLDCSSATGSETFISDSITRVKKTDWYSPQSPRMMWPCQFLETFDFRNYIDDWYQMGYDDRAWEHAEDLGAHPIYPWDHRMIAREIPYFNEIMKHPHVYWKGDYQINGFHVLSFQDIVPPGENKIVFAQTHVYCGHKQEAWLNISCDDAFKAFLNGSPVMHQGYDDEFVHGSVWSMREDYEQFHYGVGIRKEAEKVQLHEGWNKLFIAVDLGPGGWGLTVGFADPDCHADQAFTTFNPTGYLDLHCSFNNDGSNGLWMLAGPLESSGLKNSLDHIVQDTIPGNAKTFPYHSLQYSSSVTDYSLMMRAEEKSNITKHPYETPIELHEGQFIILDLQKVKCGYATLDIEAEDGAVLDIGLSNVLPSDMRIPFMWQVRYVDRLYLRDGQQSWRGHFIKEGQFIYISCRRGNLIRINEVGINTQQYPVQDIGRFECSDGTLNRIWEVSRYTSHILMLDTYQGSIKREGGVPDVRSLSHSFMAAFLCFGDHDLMRKNIMDMLRTQIFNGWFSAHSYSDQNRDEPTMMLYWLELVKNFAEYSGERDFIQSIYERTKGMLRYFSRIENSQMLIDCKNEFFYPKDRYCYIDDSTASDYPYIGAFDGLLFGYNIVYYGALMAAVKLAELLGMEEDRRRYAAKAAHIKQVCNTVFWDEERQQFADWRMGDQLAPKSSQAFLVSALYYDLCDDEKKEKVLSYLCDTLGASENRFDEYNFTVGMYYYFLEVLFRNGKDETAINLMRAYYGAWLDMGGTTFGEHFTLKGVTESSRLQREYSTHDYSTSAHAHFYSSILGVTPSEPGFSKMKIEPKPGKLNWAKGKMYTPFGEVSVSWKANGDLFRMEVQAPRECEFVLPSNFTEHQVIFNGEKVVLLNGHETVSEGFSR